VKRGQQISREAVLGRLVDMLYERNDMNFSRGKFRVRGDVVEVYPATADEEAIRLEFFGDEIDAITRFDPLTGHAHEALSLITFYPAKQFVTPADKLNRALSSIRNELDHRIVELESQSRLLEAQRLKMRTEYDLEMLQEMGFCNGIENYSRHLSGRMPGSKPFTLLDFFPKDYLLVIDESHATIPQIGGMYEGDRSRKTVLVEYGFRLPSALDNRPLNFKEFMGMANQLAYVSATPAEFEIKNSVVGNKGYFPHKRERIGEEELVPFVVAGEAVAAVYDRRRLQDGAHRAPLQQNPKAIVSRTDQPPEEFDVHTPGAPLVVEQIIRPTGLLDPKITLKPLKNQIDETIELCRQRVESQERVLVTTLTKRTAEDLSDYLRDVGLKVRYLHSDIDTIERVEILRGLRAADFDILVGINLLREGLDLPEVSLVCILDADKEGFLRSQTSLIQTAGRAARHINGEVVLFADTVTQSMQALISISDYRRTKQMEYNEKHGITPTTVKRAIQESLHTILRGREIAASVIQEAGGDFNLTELLRELEDEMQSASANLEFERAALLRDQIMEVKSGTGLTKIEPKRRPVKYSRGGAQRRRGSRV
jgi:excinuclease ABC subunit B